MTLQAFSTFKSSLFPMLLNLPFNRPKAFSTTTLLFSCCVLCWNCIPPGSDFHDQYMVSSANCWGHKLSHLISGEEHVHKMSSPTCRPEEKLWHNTRQTMESSWRRVRRVLYPAIQHIYQEIDNYNLLAPEGLMREIPSCKHNHLDFVEVQWLGHGNHRLLKPPRENPRDF